MSNFVYTQLSKRQRSLKGIDNASPTGRKFTLTSIWHGCASVGHRWIPESKELLDTPIHSPHGSVSAELRGLIEMAHKV